MSEKVERDTGKESEFLIDDIDASTEGIE